jgi:hypothetical protein
MSFEPTDDDTSRPTTDIQPLVPIQPSENPSTRDRGRRPTTPSDRRPRRTDYASPDTRDREEITPGVTGTRDA